MVIFAGLPGAGKSTFYRARFAATHEHVSKDLFPNARSRARRQAQQIEAVLDEGRSVVADNTNASVEDRAALIALGRAHGAEIIGYFFLSSVGESLRRNAERSGRQRVPDVAIFATAKRLVPPSHAEGFDRLYEVRIEGEGRFACRLLPGGPL